MTDYRRWFYVHTDVKPEVKPATHSLLTTHTSSCTRRTLCLTLQLSPVNITVSVPPETSCRHRQSDDDDDDDADCPSSGHSYIISVPSPSICYSVQSRLLHSSASVVVSQLEVMVHLQGKSMWLLTNED